MWEFPNVQLRKSGQVRRKLKKKVEKDFGVAVKRLAKLSNLRHTYSHFRASVEVYRCEMKNSPSQAYTSMKHRWVRVTELADFPMGKLDRQIAKLLLLM